MGRVLELVICIICYFSIYCLRCSCFLNEYFNKVMESVKLLGKLKNKLLRSVPFNELIWFLLMN